MTQTIPDVLVPLDEYAAGHATGNPQHFRRAFLPTAHVEGLRDGEFTTWDLDTYCSRFTGRPAETEDRHVRTVNHVQVSGSVAVATMTLDHVDAVFTDMFLLVHVPDGWRIANKVYHRAPK